MTVKKSGGDSYNNPDFAQPMFASWDNVEKEWKHTPNALSIFSLGFKNVFLVNNLLNQLRYHKQPFGTIDLIGSASGTTNKFVFNQYGPDVLSSYNQPVTSFGFPHQSIYGLPGGAQNMPVENLIKMSDFITKPFLLEKVVIEFDAKFEFSDAAESRNPFRVMYVSGTNSVGPSDRHFDNASIMIPSFYVLNVKKNIGKKFNSEIVIDDNNILTSHSWPDSSFDYDFVGNKDKTGCDLVTYGQMTLYITGSGMKMNMEKALDDGLGRDSIYDIAKLNKQPTYSLGSSINPFTSSFRIEMPVRNMPRTNYNQRTLHKDSSGNLFGIFSSNPEGGRSLPTQISGSGYMKPTPSALLPKSSLPPSEHRGLVNNFSTTNINSVKRYQLGNTAQAAIPYDVVTSGFSLEDVKQSTSPYLLFPSDRLSFGFAYPVPMLAAFNQPDTSETKTNRMTLGGNYKVHFYGSLVKEGKEYHETMNQSLTTVEISEPIGCESVVDKFNIATKDEYFGSYIDKIPIATSGHLSPGGASASDETLYSFENRNSGEGTFRIIGKGEFLPADRISLKAGSKVHHFYTYQIASASLLAQYPGRVHKFHGKYLSPTAQPEVGSLSPTLAHFLDPAETKHYYRKTLTFPFTEHANNNRRYADEGKVNVLPGKNQQLISRERYKFSYNHFGHYADLLDSAKDSKYSITNDSGMPLNLNFSKKLFSLNTSPVSIKFVTGSKIENDTFYYEVTQSNASHNKTVDSTLASYFDELKS